MKKIDNFYAICKGLVFRGWMSVESGQNIADGKLNEPSPKDLTTFKVIPEQSLDFCHFLTHSLIEICYSGENCNLKYVHSGNKQSQGEGSRCMSVLSELCDEYDITIELEAFAHDKSSRTARRLVAFYKRFGFAFNVNHIDREDVMDENELNDDYIYGIPMIRHPNAK
ncbi:hypothetical protein ACODM8_13680 [Vibrio ostreicida]|uniref:hypothetical protein n=1 Tax=Vibrio ostreicida TaxID=526588 RepID=UPI003B5CCDBB